MQQLRSELAASQQTIRSLEAELQDTMDAAMQLWDTVQVRLGWEGVISTPSTGPRGGGIQGALAEPQDTIDAAMQLCDTVQVWLLVECIGARECSRVCVEECGPFA